MADLETYVDVLLFAIILFVSAWSSWLLVPAFPYPANMVMGAWFKTTYAAVDTSFMFIVVFIVFILILGAWFYPSRMRALEEFIGLLVFGYLSRILTPIITQIGNIFNANTSVPATYTFTTSTWFTVFVFFGMIVSIGFNARDTTQKHHYDSQNPNLEAYNPNNSRFEAYKDRSTNYIDTPQINDIGESEHT
jgi:hypothetical protein